MLGCHRITIRRAPKCSRQSWTMALNVGHEMAFGGKMPMTGVGRAKRRASIGAESPSTPASKDGAGDGPLLAPCAHRPLAFQDRQREAQAGARTGSGGHARRRSGDVDRARGGRHADVLRVRVAGHQDRTGPVVLEHQPHARVPRDGARRAAGHQEPVTVVDGPHQAKCPPQSAHRQERTSGPAVDPCHSAALPVVTQPQDSRTDPRRPRARRAGGRWHAWPRSARVRSGRQGGAMVK